MRITAGIAGAVLLLLAGTAAFFEDRSEPIATRLGAAFGSLALALVLAALALALYQRFAAKQRVRLRSPDVLLAGGAIAIALSLAGVERAREERRSEVSQLAQQAARCEGDEGDVFQRLPSAYRQERLGPAELAPYRQQMGEVVDLIEARDIYARGEFVARAVFAAIGPDTEQWRDFRDVVRSGAEQAGGNPQEGSIGGSDVLVWRAQGTAGVFGDTTCGGLAVIAPVERDARDLWLALGSR